MVANVDRLGRKHTYARTHARTHTALILSSHFLFSLKLCLLLIWLLKRYHRLIPFPPDV